MEINVLIVSFCVIGSLLLTYIVKRIVQKTAIIDHPNERSSHTIPTPRGGGMAIAITWFIGLGYLFVSGLIPNSLFYALSSGILICIISFIDDIFTINSSLRFGIQAFSIALALYFLNPSSNFEIAGIQFYDFSLLVPLYFFGILWFVNLYNFVDGIDGHAVTEAIFVSLALFFFTGNILSLLLAASCAGFLPWNWHKAKIFMGDIGSTLLGFTIGVFCVYYQSESLFSVGDWLILTSVFWFDATYTLIRRILNREKFFEAHRKHLYQRLVQSGMSHSRVVFHALGLNLFFFGLILCSHYFEYLKIPVVLIVLLVLGAATHWVNKQKAFE